MSASKLMAAIGSSYLPNLSPPPTEVEKFVKRQAALPVDSAQAVALAVGAAAVVVVVVVVALAQNSVIAAGSDLRQKCLRFVAAGVVSEYYRIHPERKAHHLVEMFAQACCHRTNRCFAAEAAAADCLTQIVLCPATVDFRQTIHHPVAVDLFAAPTRRIDHQLAAEVVVVANPARIILALAIVNCQIVHHFAEVDRFPRTNPGSVAAEDCQTSWTYFEQAMGLRKTFLRSHRMLRVVRNIP